MIEEIKEILQDKKKKKRFIIGIVLFFLLMTNPSINDFRIFVGEKHSSNVTKKANFFLFSIYKGGAVSYYYYLGFANNFIPLHT